MGRLSRLSDFLLLYILVDVAEVAEEVTGDEVVATLETADTVDGWPVCRLGWGLVGVTVGGTTLG